MAEHKYQNPDPRCTHHAEGSDYCWSYATFLDEGRMDDLIEQCCKQCEMWNPNANNDEWEK